MFYTRSRKNRGENTTPYYLEVEGGQSQLEQSEHFSLDLPPFK